MESSRNGLSSLPQAELCFSSCKMTSQTPRYGGLPALITNVLRGPEGRFSWISAASCFHDKTVVVFQ